MKASRPSGGPRKACGMLRSQQLTLPLLVHFSLIPAQTIVHYGWIPTILFVAYRASNPRPPLMRCVRFLMNLSSSNFADDHLVP